MNRPTVAVISAGIGAGHDGAAAELARRLIVAGLAVQRHDFLDLLPGTVGGTLRQTYAGQLRHAPVTWGWLLRAVSGSRPADGASALAYRLTADRILGAVTVPGVVAAVSTYPLASQVLGRLRRTGRLRLPAVAVLTDPSVHPLCVADGVDMHVAAGPWGIGAERRGNVDGGRGSAATGAHSGPSEHGVGEAGPRWSATRSLVGPGFRPGTGLADAFKARWRLGLPPVDRLAVVVAGSWGVGDIDRTVADIAATDAATPVVVCGRNEALRRRLTGRGDTLTLGWVKDMPSLLRAADVVVHNAGGLTTVEAMASGVPIVSYRCLPGHGKANAAVLERAGLSPWPRSEAEFTAVLGHALHGDLRERQQSAYARFAAAPDAAALIARLGIGVASIRTAVAA